LLPAGCRRYALQFLWDGLRLSAGSSGAARFAEDVVAIKRKWMKVCALAMMGIAAGFGPVNPQELAEMMHIMDEGKIEFAIPDDSDGGDGDGNRWWREIEP
jgi:hypothetical protein